MSVCTVSCDDIIGPWIRRHHWAFSLLSHQTDLINRAATIKSCRYLRLRSDMADDGVIGEAMQRRVRRYPTRPDPRPEMLPKFFQTKLAVSLAAEVGHIQIACHWNCHSKGSPSLLSPPVPGSVMFCKAMETDLPNSPLLPHRAS